MSKIIVSKIGKVSYVTDYIEVYKNSEESKKMSMFEFGIYQMEKLARIRKRGLITKREYNQNRNEIEKNLMRL